MMALDPNGVPRTLVLNEDGALLINTTGDDMGALPDGATLLSVVLPVDAAGRLVTAEE